MHYDGRLRAGLIASAFIIVVAHFSVFGSCRRELASATNADGGQAATGDANAFERALTDGFHRPSQGCAEGQAFPPSVATALATLGEPPLCGVEHDVVRMTWTHAHSGENLAIQVTWRNGDGRIVSHRRHGRSTHIVERTTPLREADWQRLVAMASTLTDAGYDLGLDGQSFAVERALGGEYAAFERFSPDPHDAVRVVAERIRTMAGEWREEPVEAGSYRTPPPVVLDSKSLVIGGSSFALSTPAERAVASTALRDLDHPTINLWVDRDVRMDRVANTLRNLDDTKNDRWVFIETPTTAGRTTSLAVRAPTTIPSCSSSGWLSKDGSVSVAGASGSDGTRFDDLRAGSDGIAKRALLCPSKYIGIGADDATAWGDVADLASQTLEALRAVDRGGRVVVIEPAAKQGHR